MDWANPDPDQWTRTLHTLIRESRYPLLIAHSLGALTVIRWAAESQACIAGAFLVAPPDPEASDAAPEISRFDIRKSLQRTVFPTLVAGSENDPFCTLSAAQRIASALDCSFWNAGAVGHINVVSGHGPWPEGRACLDRFLQYDVEPRMEAA